MKLSPAGGKTGFGFTLLEMMLVVVVIGLMATLIVTSLVGTKPEQELEHQGKRFMAVFELASEYALLNNVELGVVVKDNSYQFVGFDGEYWRELNDKDEFTKFEVQKPVLLSIQLDDLPIEEPNIIDSKLFKQEESLYENAFDDVDIGEKPDPNKPAKPKVKIIPHVYMLSGGEITPFKLVFEFDYSMNSDAQYWVSGDFSLPLTAQLVTNGNG